MNGIIRIVLGGKQRQLTFGMMSVEEIGNRQGLGTSGWFKLITDIIYSGYMNDCYLEGKALELSYRDISGFVDELLQTGSEELVEVFKCFSESKAGETITKGLKKSEAEVPKVKKRIGVK